MDKVHKNDYNCEMLLFHHKAHSLGDINGLFPKFT